MPDLLTPRRYPVAVTAEQARANEGVLRYYLGDDAKGLGDGNHEMTIRLREMVEIMEGVRVEDEAKQRRRDAIRETFLAPFRAAFREIMKLNPRLSSREARELAVRRIAR